VALKAANIHLTARVARPFVRTDRLFFQLGFLIPYFMATSFRTVMYRSTLHTHRLDKLKDEHR
jgi:hypothetical protein